MSARARLFPCVRVQAATLAALGRVACAGGVGFVWGQSTALVALSPWVIALWWASRTRLEAFAAVALYHAVAARSLIVGATRFFDVSWGLGAFAVGACASCIGLVWATCWSSRGAKQASWRAGVRLALALVLTHGGLTGPLAVASPLHAAGLWFPSAGWFGLVAAFALMVSLRRRAGLAVGLALSVVGMLSWSLGLSKYEGRDIEGLETALPVSRSALDFEAQWTVASDAIAWVRRTDAALVVLPESVGGLWQEPMQRVWTPLATELAAEGRVALVGAMFPRADGDFDNGAVLVGAAEGRYLQRAPVPLAMWRPWDEGEGEEVTHGHWLGKGTLEVQGRKLGVLVCYESALPFPVLRSVAAGAEVLVGLTNGRWLAGTGAVQAQRQSLESWGALFALPVVIAVNE